MGFLRRLFNPFSIDTKLNQEFEAMKKNTDYLFVGLGNPGSRYANTRHNIGWMVIAELCRKYRKDPVPLMQSALLAPLRIEGKAVLAAMPVTYMNNSGEAVANICRTYGICPDRIVVILDEYNFPVGKIHLRTGGSDGGHNGVSSVQDHLETQEFARLRCGIGKNFPPGGMVDYVLSNFTEEEAPGLQSMIGNAVTALEYIVRNGIPRAMSDVNSGKALTEPDSRIE